VYNSRALTGVKKEHGVTKRKEGAKNKRDRNSKENGGNFVVVQ